MSRDHKDMCYWRVDKPVDAEKSPDNRTEVLSKDMVLCMIDREIDTHEDITEAAYNRETKEEYRKELRTVTVLRSLRERINQKEGPRI